MKRKLSSKFWSVALEEWHQISGGGLQTNSLKILKLKTSSPIVLMHQVYDSDAEVLVVGRGVLEVAPRECAKKYSLKTTKFPPKWLARIGVSSPDMTAEPSMVVLHMAARQNGARGPMTILELIAILKGLDNKTAGIDGFVARLVKYMGPRGLRALLDVINSPMSTWPPELLKAVHMVMRKKPGDVILEQRPLKLLSAILRIKAKVLSRRFQALLPPGTYECRQFAGY